MDYKLWDKFMIRIPGLPHKFFEEYNKSDLDIYEFISGSEYLDKFFKKALQVSSYSLYNSYINTPKDNKKYRNLCSGLLKYFIRATCRSVPFGYYANVSIGEFGKETSIDKKYTIMDISPDTNWVNGFIRKIEDDGDYIKELSLKFNSICFVSGDRLKNPYFSNRGNLGKGEEKINENDIRNTALIDLIKSSTTDFIKYNELFKIIKDEYAGVQDEIIQETIRNLVQNEYLLTNLRLPAYCDDALKHIVDVVENSAALKDIAIILKNLQNKFFECKKNYSSDYVSDIIGLMKQLYTNNDYVELNTGFTGDNKMLDYSIKDKIEKFLDALSDISLEISAYAAVDKLRDRFVEEYGNGVEVELTQIIDRNGFDACSLIGMGYNSSQREKNIQEIINNKILIAIINNEDVKLSKNDFIDIDNKEINYAPGFDVNLYITRGDKDYNLIAGPNAGASKQGNMFQRFKNAFEKSDFDSYNKIYDVVAGNLEDDIVFAELRECTINGRQSNVTNNTQNYKYYIAIATVENGKYSIRLDDLLLGLDGKNKLYFRSKSLNKRIVFVKDNMLNTKLNSKLYQLLYEVSSSNYDLPLNRVFAFGKDMIFTPRIYLEDVIIKLKQWRFDSVILKNESIDEFKKDFENLCDSYKIDDYVYLVESDNRLVMNLKDNQYINLIYEIFKKKGEIKFSEIEPDLFNGCIVTDGKYTYVNEFVFSCYLNKNNIKSNESKNDAGLKLELVNKDRVYLPFQEGWLYFKLYGLANRTNEFLKRELDKLKGLNASKWFFIRYSDTLGSHIRLRIKFDDEDKALFAYKNISDWLYSLRNIKMIDTIQLDTYKRETNRYGGANFIELFETYSQLSSICVIETLRNFDLDEKKEDIYFFQTLIIYLNATESIEDLLSLIDSERMRKSYKREFKSKRNYLVDLAEKYIAGNFGEFECLRGSIKNMGNSVKKYSEKIDSASDTGKLTNDKSSIIGALAHMHCNRLTGDRQLEYVTLSFIRHTIFSLCEKRKHYKRG